jgi:YD repeat-containing protein
VVPAPVITSVEPLQAPAGENGVQITILGNNFGTTQGSVTFNGSSVTSFTSWSATSIVVSVPSGATTGNVVVNASGVASNGIYFLVLPEISTISPAYGSSGTAVTISGAGFGSSKGQGFVTFNGAVANVTSWNSTSIVATVPTGASSGYIGLSTNEGATATNGPYFQIGSLSQPIYHFHNGTGSQFNTGGLLLSSAAPSGANTIAQSANLNGNSSGQADIQTFSTVYGVPGEMQNADTFTVWMNETSSVAGLYPKLTLYAFNSINYKDYNIAQFSQICSVTSSTALTTTLTKYTLSCTPSGGVCCDAVSSFMVDVSVSWTGGKAIKSNVEAQLYYEGTLNGTNDSSVTIPEILQPYIYSFSPTAGPQGTVVTVSGSGFGANPGSITFNGVTGIPSSWTDSSIVVPVPVNAKTGPVVVQANSQTSQGFEYIVTSSITQLSPNAGIPGTPVTISGSGFGDTQSTSMVFFNNAPAVATSWSNTSITAVVPPGASSGPVAVSVNGAASTSLAFSVGPTIAAISPTSGKPQTTVIITGINFGSTQGPSTVAFNGVAANVSGWSNTQIVATVPAGAASGPITVTVNSLQSNGLTFSIGNGTIAGTVSQASNGLALSGATVNVLRAKSIAGTATTASDGSYSVGNLQPGTYDVIASAAGFGSLSSFGNSVTAGTTTPVNLSLPSPGTMSGQVTAANGGNPVSGATVNVLSGGDVVGSASTDSMGNYSIATLSAGTYSAQAALSGYQPNFQANISISAGNTTTQNFTLAGQRAITYTYDAVGRLIGVVDPQGNAVTYTYDAVGNLQSTTEYASSQTSIIGFSPSSGAVGTTVTISGTGFSSTASQNAVSFNGTAASVTYATATQLVVTVPSGATTGQINVTSPDGSATSSASYVVSQ